MLTVGGIAYRFHQNDLRNQQEKIAVALDSLQKTLGPAVPVNVEKLVDMKRTRTGSPGNSSGRYLAANESREKLSLAFALASSVKWNQIT